MRQRGGKGPPQTGGFGLSGANSFLDPDPDNWVPFKEVGMLPFARRRMVAGLAVLIALAAPGVAAPARAQAASSSFQIGLIGDPGYTTGQDSDLLAVRKS